MSGSTNTPDVDLTTAELALPELVVVVPTRGRPENVTPLLTAVRATATARTRIVFALDAGDPTTSATINAAFAVREDENHRSAGIMADEVPDAGLVVLSRHDSDPFVTVGVNESMAQAANRSALFFAWMSSAVAVAVFSDTALPRTQGWDTSLLEALHATGGGFAAPNDLHSGDVAPPHVAISTDVIRALGFVAPPTMMHLHLPEVWKLWGEGAGRFTFLPDVVVEHVHPMTGKTPWTLHYTEARTPERTQRDLGLFRDYLLNRSAEDTRTVRNALSEDPDRAPGGSSATHPLPTTPSRTA